MKIMSFNTQHCLNFIERKIDFNVMAKAINDCGADIVGLNEMRGDGPDGEYTDQVKALSELTGMQYYCFAPAIYVKNSGPYGNGFLSKIPIESTENIIIPDPTVKNGKMSYETRCVLKATLKGGVTVLVTHFGLNPDEQENAVKTVTEALTDVKCILMGDFNLPPESVLLHPIRGRMTDTATVFEKELLSFPSDEPTRKIDYIFVSGDLKISNANIPPIVASDHRPHVAEISI